jgi:hypothetical protein
VPNLRSDRAASISINVFRKARNGFAFITDCVFGVSRFSIQNAAAASKRTAPSPTSARPGQFDFIPKPLAGFSGSRVSLATTSERRRLPLSRRRSGWSAMNTTPLKNNAAPTHMSTMIASTLVLFLIAPANS